MENDPIKLDRRVKEAASKLEVTKAAVEESVRRRRYTTYDDDDDDGIQGRRITFPEIEPWEELVDLAEVLDDIVALLKRFVVPAGREGAARRVDVSAKPTASTPRWAPPGARSGWGGSWSQAKCRREDRRR
jgi:hypothetical protein